jgi:hypothetical protein
MGRMRWCSRPPIPVVMSLWNPCRASYNVNCGEFHVSRSYWIACCGSQAKTSQVSQLFDGNGARSCNCSVVNGFNASVRLSVGGDCANPGLVRAPRTTDAEMIANARFLFIGNSHHGRAVDLAISVVRRLRGDRRSGWLSDCRTGNPTAG